LHSCSFAFQTRVPERQQSKTFASLGWNTRTDSLTTTPQPHAIPGRIPENVRKRKGKADP
jgi:hypothetical protein